MEIRVFGKGKCEGSRRKEGMARRVCMLKPSSESILMSARRLLSEI